MDNDILLAKNLKCDDLVNIPPENISLMKPSMDSKPHDAFIYEMDIYADIMAGMNAIRMINQNICFKPSTF